MEERFIRVPRTARYHLLGDPATARSIWFVLHGYGQLARFFLKKFEGLQEELCIVAPEGLSRFYVDAAHGRVGATWMTREDREHEIQDHVEYLDLLATQVRSASAEYAPINVLGFSQGVATASRWAMRGSTRFARLVLWSGSMPAEFVPAELQERWHGMTVQLVHGAADPVVPALVAQQNAALLSAANVVHSLTTFDGGHELDPVTIKHCLIG